MRRKFYLKRGEIDVAKDEPGLSDFDHEDRVWVPTRYQLTWWPTQVFGYQPNGDYIFPTGVSVGAMTWRGAFAKLRTIVRRPVLRAVGVRPQF